MAIFMGIIFLIIFIGTWVTGGFATALLTVAFLIVSGIFMMFMASS
jgi:hypothetical protein